MQHVILITEEELEEIKELAQQKGKQEMTDEYNRITRPWIIANFMHEFNCNHGNDKPAAFKKAFVQHMLDLRNNLRTGAIK